MSPAGDRAEELETSAHIGMTLPDTDPILHFTRRLDVLARPPERINA